MSTPNINNLSYTNKDFNSIYNEILDTTSELTNKWSPRESNESDPGVVLLKEMALIADKLNYNIDKNILEAFPETVTQEYNARNLYEQLGYKMPWYRSATGTCELKWTGEQIPLTAKLSAIPAFSMLSDSNSEIVYTTTQDAQFAYGIEELSVPVIEGTVVVFKVNGSEVIQLSSIDSQRRLYLGDYHVAENGVFISTVENSQNYWMRVDNIMHHPLGTKCYEFCVDARNNLCYLRFPEDMSALIGQGLLIKYVVSSGEKGNIAPRTLSTFFTPVTIDYNGETRPVDDSVVRLTNSSSCSGGSDPETIEDAYDSYKRVCGTFDTLVTTKDYENAIKSSGLVSNVVVSDRTNDCQSSFTVVTEDTLNPTYDCTRSITLLSSDFNNDQVINNKDLGLLERYINGWELNLTEVSSITIPEMTAYDLKIYGLTPVTSADDDYYDESFNVIQHYSEFLNSTENKQYRNIVNYLNNSKSVCHDFSDFMSDKPIIFKNVYSLNIKLLTSTSLNTVEQESVKTNILDKLRSFCVSSSVEFGSSPNYAELESIIKSSDSRIQAVLLDLIDPVTFAVYWDQSNKVFKEIPISYNAEKSVYCYDCRYTDPEDADNTLQIKTELESKEAYRSNIRDVYLLYNNKFYKFDADTETIYLYSDKLNDFRNAVIVRSVLAGKTSLFIMDDKFDIRLNHKFVSLKPTERLSSFLYIDPAATMMLPGNYVEEHSYNSGGEASESWTAYQFDISSAPAEIESDEDGYNYRYTLNREADDYITVFNREGTFGSSPYKYTTYRPNEYCEVVIKSTAELNVDDSAVEYSDSIVCKYGSTSGNGQFDNSTDAHKAVEELHTKFTEEFKNLKIKIEIKHLHIGKVEQCDYTIPVQVKRDTTKSSYNYKLRDNESIRLYAPSFTSDVNYSNYVRYELVLGSALSTALSKFTDIDPNESYIIDVREESSYTALKTLAENAYNSILDTYYPHEREVNQVLFTVPNEYASDNSGVILRDFTCVDDSIYKEDLVVVDADTGDKLTLSEPAHSTGWEISGDLSGMAIQITYPHCEHNIDPKIVLRDKTTGIESAITTEIITFEEMINKDDDITSDIKEVFNGLKSIKDGNLQGFNVGSMFMFDGSHKYSNTDASRWDADDKLNATISFMLGLASYECTVDGTDVTFEMSTPCTDMINMFESRGATTLKEDKEFQLREGDQITFFWRDASESDEAPFKYVTYVGTSDITSPIICPSFPVQGNIKGQSKLDHSKFVDEEGFVYFDSAENSAFQIIEDMYGNYVLSGSKQIVLKHVNEVTLPSNGFHAFITNSITTDGQSSNICNLTLEKLPTIEGTYQYILQEDEYFMNVNRKQNACEIYNPGTAIRFKPVNSSGEDTITWTCSYLDYKKLLSVGINAFKDKLVANADRGGSINVREQVMYNLTSGSILRVTKPVVFRSDKFTYIDPDTVIEYITSESSITTLPQIALNDGTGWVGNASLNIIQATDNPQEYKPVSATMIKDRFEDSANKSLQLLLIKNESGEWNPVVELNEDSFIGLDENGQIASETSLPVKYYDVEPAYIQSDFPLSKVGGYNIDLTYKDSYMKEQIPELYIYQLNDIEGLETTGREFEFSWDNEGDSKSVFVPIKWAPGKYLMSVERGTESSYVITTDYELNNANIIQLNTTQLNTTPRSSYDYWLVDATDESTLCITGDSPDGKITIKQLSRIKNNTVDYCADYESIKDEIMKLDTKSLFKYNYRVKSSENVGNPLVANSFFDDNHVFNKYTIPKANLKLGTLNASKITFLNVK